MTLVDPNSEFGARVLRRLEQEVVVWLTTVGSDGTPQPSPVWFLWDGTSVLIYSRPNTPKVRNIARSGKVALNFNTTPDGGDVIIITGTAQLDDTAPPATALPAYMSKYAEDIVRIGMTNESFAAEYSQAISFTPEKVRGF